MKTYFSVLIVLIALSLGTVSCNSGDSSSTYVDSYTSASDTKSFLSGSELEPVVAAFVAGSSDLATAAEAAADDYVMPHCLLVNVMSTCPDGSVTISTIAEWAYYDKDKDQVAFELTYGQNALNIAESGRGTIFISNVDVEGKEYRYFIHLKVTDLEILEYSQEAYDAGEFNAYYTGAEKEKSQYSFICDVLSVEEVSTSVKLGNQMP